LVDHWGALEGEDTVDQLLGVTHFLHGFVVDVLVEAQISPVLAQGRMQEILVDRDQFPSERFVEPFAHFW